MASDANTVLQALTNRSTTLSSTALTINATPRRGMKAQIVYASNDSVGSCTVAFTIAGSLDGGSTFTTLGTSATLTVGASTSTTAQSKEVFIPFEIYPSNPATPAQ